MKFDVNILYKWFVYNPAEPLLFQTLPFFILFSLFYIVFSFFHKKIVTRNSLLLVFSLFFYYKISGLFVFALIAMGLFDFFIAHQIFKEQKESKKHLWLLLSFLINIGSLIYFKYTYFFINLINDISYSNISLSFKILQPIGISYFVFKSLSYVIDVNREVIEQPEKNPINYLLFVSFFPNILAGPITKARDLLPQLNTSKQLSKSDIGLAIYMISVGLVKKIVVADYIAANISDRVFESPQFFTSFDLLMSSYAGLLHLFFDFSGYTDMAIGLSLLFGLEITGNFNQPFKAKNISDFWKRWHISLYSWLNDYVYQPFAFSLREYKMKGTILAIFITFFISGLWHGANMTFVVWGLLHGTAIVFEILTQRFRSYANNKLNYIYTFFSILLTFNFLAFTSVLINSSDLNYAFEYYQRMFSGLDLTIFSKWITIYYVPFSIMTAAFVFQFLPLKFYSAISRLFNRLPIPIMALFFGLLILFLYQIASKEALPFIYIEF